MDARSFLLLWLAVMLLDALVASSLHSLKLSCEPFSGQNLQLKRTTQV